MRIALINPPTIASTSTFAQEAVPPLGLAYVCAAIRQSGFDVTVIDAVGEALQQHTIYSRAEALLLRGLTWSEIIARVPSDVDFIGVSCQFSAAWCPTRDLIVKLREAFPSVPIIIGGEHATACAEFILRTCPAVDHCVMGEGEQTIRELLECLRDGEDPRAIPGVVTRGEGRAAVRAPKRPRIRAIDTIPEPDWDSFPLEAYMAGHFNHGVVRGRSMPILASRGCPYQCTFCSSPQMWTTKWVARQPVDLLAEMKKYIAQYDVNDFAFYDLTAIIKRDWLIEFCELLIAEKLNVTWQLPSGTRSEAIDATVARLLYKAGCRNMNYAPESGSPSVLKRIKKRVDLDKMIESIRLATGEGLEIKVNIILGFPGETRAEVAETLGFIGRLARLGIEAVSVFSFCAYPGSEIFRELQASGRIVLDDTYFNGLVFTDVRRTVSYNQNASRREVQAQILAGNAVFFGLQALSHPRRTINMARQIFRHEQASKVNNAIEPMRQRRAVFRRLISEGRDSTAP